MPGIIDALPSTAYDPDVQADASVGNELPRHQAHGAERGTTATLERIRANSQPRDQESPEWALWNPSGAGDAATTWGWLSAAPDDAWRRAKPTVAQRTHDFFGRHLPYGFRERTWARPGYWRRRSRMLAGTGALLVITLVAGILALTLASHAIRSTANVHLPNQPFGSSAPGGGVVIQPVTGNAIPTPAPLTYSAGVWISNDSPSIADEIQVYVRITDNVAPVANVPVNLTIDYSVGGPLPYGPVLTDADGLATFTVTFTNQMPAQPIYVTANAISGTTTITGTTVFVPH